MNPESFMEDHLSRLKIDLKFLYYAKALSLLAESRLGFENQLNITTDKEQKKIFEYFIREINILINKYRDFQYNLLKGKSTFDAIDALGACMVFDAKQAKNILYHASVYSDFSRQWSFQDVLDDLLIEHENVVGIPFFKFDAKKGIFNISIIDKNFIEKDLHDTHFIGHDYNPSYTLKHGTITDYYIIGKRLLRFFKYYDWSITKYDLVVFYITLTQIHKEKTSPLEIDIVRNKINNIFSVNKEANRKLCTLIDLSRSYIASMVDLRDSLSEYFTKDTGLSSSTLRKYLSENVFIEENTRLYKQEIKGICRV